MQGLAPELLAHLDNLHHQAFMCLIHKYNQEKPAGQQEFFCTTSTFLSSTSFYYLKVKSKIFRKVLPLQSSSYRRWIHFTLIACLRNTAWAFAQHQIIYFTLFGNWDLQANVFLLEFFYIMLRIFRAILCLQPVVKLAIVAPMACGILVSTRTNRVPRAITIDPNHWPLGKLSIILNS